MWKLKYFITVHGQKLWSYWISEDVEFLQKHLTWLRQTCGGDGNIIKTKEVIA